MFRKFVLYFVVMLLAIFGAFYFSGARADSMTLHTPDGASIVLTDSPCSPEILENIKEEYQDKFKAARVTMGGETQALCWIAHEDNAVIIDGQGFGVAVPLGSFMKTSAVRPARSSI